jgi:hypothetical protein
MTDEIRIVAYLFNRILRKAIFFQKGCRVTGLFKLCKERRNTESCRNYKSIYYTSAELRFALNTSNMTRK